MHLAIELPEIDTQELGKTELEIRLDLAIFFYLAWQMPPGRCAAYVGISKIAFLNELGRRGIPLNYNLEALQQDQVNWTNFLSKHDNSQRHHLS